MLAASLAAWLAAAAAAATDAPADSSIRCAGGIVRVGDTKLDLLGKCGLPAHQDVRREERGRGTVLAIEQWSYDLGPDGFIMAVTLERGRVVAIERGAHGRGAAAATFEPRRARCGAAALRVGLGKLEILQACGEPASKDAWQEERAVSRVDAAAGAASSATTASVERWIYDFGRDRFTQVVTFEDGKVVLVERGGYGYAR
jgi:hypothetical protein